jgi:hypothetical protein
MGYAHGETVTRLRKQLVTDPYTNKPTAGDWSNPDELPLEGAFVASSSSTSLRNATRTQILTSKSLYLRKADADVREGDRIRAGSHTYSVVAVPAADKNPFTGRRPAVEIPLEEAQG